MPFFVDGELFCWLQNTGHWPDIGGMVPGGFSAHATEVEQEGLRLPPVKLFKRGVIDGEILVDHPRPTSASPTSASATSRPRRRRCTWASARLTELIDRYGAATVEAAIGEIRARAAQLMRAEIAAMPDGVYRVGGLRRLRRRGQRAAAHRARRHQGRRDADLRLHRLLAALPRADELGARDDLLGRLPRRRHIFPDTPLNAGAFEPLRIIRPEGTFLDARYPRPVSGCAAEVSQRIAEAVFLALVQAIPDKVTAAPAGTSGNFALGGFDPASGAGYVMYQISGGGYGGNAGTTA